MSDNQPSCFYVDMSMHLCSIFFLMIIFYMCIKKKKKGKNTLLVPEVCLLCIFGLLSFE